MPINSKWSTEEAVESAWSYALSQNTMLSTLGVDTIHLGQLQSTEIAYPFVMVSAANIVPATRKFHDRIEIATTEIIVRVSKRKDLAKQKFYDLCGAVRAVLLADDLKTWLNSDLTDHEIYNELYQPEAISSIDSTDALYHGRTFDVAISIGPVIT